MRLMNNDDDDDDLSLYPVMMMRLMNNDDDDDLSLYPVMIWLRSSTYLSSVATSSFSTFSRLCTEKQSKCVENENILRGSYLL